MTRHKLATEARYIVLLIIAAYVVVASYFALQ